MGGMIMWLARDQIGDLYLYQVKPTKGVRIWYVQSPTMGCIEVNPNLFPEIKWEDEEPTEVNIAISIK